MLGHAYDGREAAGLEAAAGSKKRTLEELRTTGGHVDSAARKRGVRTAHPRHLARLWHLRPILLFSRRTAICASTSGRGADAKRR